MTKIRVYIASIFENRFRLRPMRDEVNKIPGFLVTASWLDEQLGREATPPGSEEADEAGERDVEEVTKADVFILDTLEHGGVGGRDVELGVALSTGSITYRVGPPRNVFHGLVHFAVSDWPRLLQRLKRQSAALGK